MNFLFHMLLSGDDDELLVGNFMGDFVKGPLEDRFPARIRKGVELHRRIDSYAEKSVPFRRSRGRLSPAYGLYRGIMVDMFYDYFLVTDWSAWSQESFDGFLRRSRKVVSAHRHAIPAAMEPLLPVIFDELLPSYGSIEGIGRALARISRRIGRQNPLAGSERELVRVHDVLFADFRVFTPAIIAYAATVSDDSARPDL